MQNFFRLEETPGLVRETVCQEFMLRRIQIKPIFFLFGIYPWIMVKPQPSFFCQAQWAKGQACDQKDKLHLPTKVAISVSIVKHSAWRLNESWRFQRVKTILPTSTFWIRSDKIEVFHYRIENTSSFLWPSRKSTENTSLWCRANQKFLHAQVGECVLFS